MPQGLHAVQKESRDSTIRTSTEASTAQRLSRRRPQQWLCEERDYVSLTPAKSKAVGERSAGSRSRHRSLGSMGTLFFAVKRKEMGSICVDDVGGIFGDRGGTGRVAKCSIRFSPKQEKATRCSSAEAAICCQRWLRLQLHQQSVVIQMHRQDARKFSPHVRRIGLSSNGTSSSRVARRHPFTHVLWSGCGQRGSASGFFLKM